MGQFNVHCFVCQNTTCASQGSEAVWLALRDAVRERGRADVRVNKSGCLGQCGYGPNAVIYPENTWASELHVEDIAELADYLCGTGPFPERRRYVAALPGVNKRPAPADSILVPQVATPLSIVPPKAERA